MHWTAVEREVAEDPLLRMVCDGWIGTWVLDVIDAFADMPVPALSEGEEAIASRFRFAKDRALYRSAHMLKRSVHAAILGCRSGTLAYRYDDLGKPHLLGSGHLSFSLSHGGRFVAVAVSLSGSCGVDVEAQDAVASAQLPWPELLHEREKQGIPCLRKIPCEYALALWTLKEAASKAIGLGLSLPPREIETPSLASWSAVSQSAFSLTVHGRYRRSMPASALVLSDDKAAAHQVAAVSSAAVRGFAFRRVAAESMRQGQEVCRFLALRQPPD